MSALHRFLKKELAISDSLIEEVASYYEEETLDKGHFITKEQSVCRKMCIIESGYIRFHSYTNQKSITHWIFGSDQIVTDVASFFTHQPSIWNIQSLTECKVYSLTSANHNLIRKEIKEWDHLEKLFIIKLFAALEHRIYTLLSMSSKQRYEYLFNSDSNMFNEIPLQYLASMLGMTPETLSRIRKKQI